jgi:hypothetical protein
MRAVLDIMEQFVITPTPSFIGPTLELICDAILFIIEELRDNDQVVIHPTWTELEWIPDEIDTLGNPLNIDRKRSIKINGVQKDNYLDILYVVHHWFHQFWLTGIFHLPPVMGVQKETDLTDLANARVEISYLKAVNRVLRGTISTVERHWRKFKKDHMTTSKRKPSPAEFFYRRRKRTPKDKAIRQNNQK